MPSGLAASQLAPRLPRQRVIRHEGSRIEFSASPKQLTRCTHEPKMHSSRSGTTATQEPQSVSRKGNCRKRAPNPSVEARPNGKQVPAPGARRCGRYHPSARPGLLLAVGPASPRTLGVESHSLHRHPDARTATWVAVRPAGWRNFCSVSHQNANGQWQRRRICLFCCGLCRPEGSNARSSRERPSGWPTLRPQRRDSTQCRGPMALPHSSVPIRELLNQSFVSRNTSFGTLDDLLAASHHCRSNRATRLAGTLARW